MLHSAVSRLQIVEMNFCIQRFFQDLIFPNSTTYGINLKRLDT